MSRLLEVSRSGYYEWQKAQAVRLRGENQRQRFLDQCVRQIHDISPRAFVPVTTIQSKRKSTLPDLVKRLFDQGQLNRVWMSDITYLDTNEGWLYLCVVRDGHSPPSPRLVHG